MFLQIKLHKFILLILFICHYNVLAAHSEIKANPLETNLEDEATTFFLENPLEKDFESKIRLIDSSLYENQARFIDIASENLKTIISLPQTKNVIKQDTKSKKWHEVLLENLKDHLHLSEKIKRELVFNLFSLYENTFSFHDSTVLDGTSWKDLELLCGPKSDPKYYAGSQIDFTKTESGRVLFFKMLVSPTDNLDLLTRNQEIIKELYENKVLYEALEKQLAILEKTESALLSCWQEDAFYDAIKQDELHIPYAKNASAYINKTPSLVEMAAYTKLVSTIGANITMLTAAVLLPILGITTITESNSLFIKEMRIQVEKQGLHAIGFISLFGFIFKGLNAIYPNNKNVKGAEGIIVGPTSAFPALFFPDYMRYIITFRLSLQTKLMYIAYYIKTLKKISFLINTSPILKKHTLKAGQLYKKLNILGKESEDARHLFTLLDSSTFKGKPSFFSWYGRINVTYSLLHKVKNELITSMMAAGELDAYMSCVRFIKKMKEQNTPICFPRYISTENPSIEIIDFWNPTLTEKKTITNSLYMGCYKNPKNIIVTGPNAGGKSTTMKGLLLNIILAQTFGIATCSSLIFTPFSKIITYLNITDDIAAGKSHFKAGASRAQDLIKTVQSVNFPQFCLTAVDEVFDGTSFYEGQAAAYVLIEELSNYAHNMCVTITHFEKVPLLEKKYPDRFLNYKVTASFKNNGEIVYPYKIEKGISQQNIAFNILKREGFSDIFIQKAENILNE